MGWENAKITLNHYASLERTYGEQKKTDILMVIVYYSGRMQIKISTGKKHTGQGPEETVHKLPGVVFQENHLVGLSSPSNDV